MYIPGHSQAQHGSFIPSRTYPIPLDLGSQAGLGENSTAVGDHVGSPRDELFLQFFLLLWHFVMYQVFWRTGGGGVCQAAILIDCMHDAGSGRAAYQCHALNLLSMAHHLVRSAQNRIK